MAGGGAGYGHGQGVVELPFLDFAPDLAYDVSMAQKQVVLIDCDNAAPTMKGYQALNGLAPYTTGVPGDTILGSTVSYFSDGSTKVWAGGQNLWRLDAGGWTVVGTGIGAGTTARWRFTQFGDDVIAVNPGGGAVGSPVTPVAPIVAPQVATGSGGSFAALGGSPPTNATCAVAVNGQVLMFSGANWYCSALGTDNNWTPNIQTQAGQGVLYDYPGVVVAAAPIFRNCIVFKQTATWLGSYVGGYPVWSWQLISDLTGTWCQESVIPMPDCVAFVGSDDFYICSGYTPQRIPNSLKEWFFDVSDPNYFTSMLSRYDANHGICYWYFVSRIPPTPVAGVPDRWVAWNSRTGKWGGGYLPANGARSVPQPNQQPGIVTGLIFNSVNQLFSWTGPPGIMRLDTSYMGTPNNLTQCMRMKPIYYVEPTSATVIPYHVRNLGDADITGPTTWLNQSDGWYYFRQYDRWHRFSLSTVGPDVMPTTIGMSGAEVSAIAIDYRQGGWR